MAAANHAAGHKSAQKLSTGSSTPGPNDERIEAQKHHNLVLANQVCADDNILAIVALD